MSIFSFLLGRSRSTKSVHIVGIGGIGVSRVARFYKAHGIKVRGSDLVANEVTKTLEQEGVEVLMGHNASHLAPDCDLVVYTIAINEGNPERVEAKKRKIRQLAHFEAIQELAKGKRMIAVCGTNGKSTTTALLGMVLAKANLDPTVFVGSLVPEWQGNLRIGGGQYVIVEADELNRQFLALKPWAILITNIELDHLDYFKDLRDIRSAFVEFIAKLPKEGVLIFNHDDEVTMEAVEESRYPNKHGFGRSGKAIRLRSVVVFDQRQTADITLHGEERQFWLQVPGLHNIFNALGAIGIADFLQIRFGMIQFVLERYLGIWRRFQIVGRVNSTLIVSDYGHHPTAIRSTIRGVREFYPGKRLLVVFQPHQRRRTQALFSEFIRVFVDDPPDELIICEIFDVAGRDDQEEMKLSSLDLVSEISKRFPKVLYSQSVADAEKKAQSRVGQFDIVVFMGAGDIYRAAENLVTINPSMQ